MTFHLLGNFCIICQHLFLLRTPRCIFYCMFVMVTKPQFVLLFLLPVVSFIITDGSMVTNDNLEPGLNSLMLFMCVPLGL